VIKLRPDSINCAGGATGQLVRSRCYWFSQWTFLFFLENLWNIALVVILIYMYVDYMLYDCDVGKIAGQVQREVTCSPMGDRDSRRISIGCLSATKTMPSPCHVTSCSGLHATWTNGREACEHPSLNPVDDQGC
jgi:hypothetical protein